MKQQEDDIDLHVLALICVRSVDDAVFARQLFLVSVIILSACAKDDTADMDGEQVGVPHETPPVAAPEWYPTPKRTGPPAYRVLPPADRRDTQEQDTWQGREVPAAGRTPYDDGRFDLDNVQWPSDEQEQKYSPWTSEQTPSPGTDGPPGWVQPRPWGSVEEGTGRPPRPQQSWQYPGAQPAYPPGVYGQYPQDYPGYIW